MKIVVIGGSGLIGKHLIARLTAAGHRALPASPRSGVNALTGEGLDEILRGAAVVVDVSNSPSFAADAVMNFFTVGTRNLLAAEATAGVGHHVALSVVGSERLLDSGYFPAKIAQEKLIRESPIPYSIVRATQFFEFVKTIADGSANGHRIPLPAQPIQPIAADDVAAVLAEVTVGAPLNGMVEVAGPDRLNLDDLVRQSFAATGDTREVVTDPDAAYFGAMLQANTLVPSEGARLGPTHFADWLARLAT